ncbi:MAG TPA: NHLP bacteriocin export ABC transporter permease/ATPase subunit [Thermoanaerobaculia bacterium]|jgi:ATP-binding cassette subfamily C protein|nr:NHLP bacteriocin export ABC transporter permease/ATPase subunit [Thermoanaerobaculia bacterium]
MASPSELEPIQLNEPTEVPLAGNAPLLLDSGGEVWLIEEGMAEVFAVPRGETGPRIHLSTVSAGGILCGYEPAQASSHGLGLLAVGAPGTRLRRLPADEVPGLAGLLDGWLAGLGGGLVRPAFPRSFAGLRSGEETRLEPGWPARSREGVVWVRHLEGRTYLLGDERLGIEGNGLFPVPEAVWLVAAGEARLASCGTTEALRDGALRSGLARFHGLCLEAVAYEREKGRQFERERLEHKRDLDRSVLRGAYARLTSVLESSPLAGAGLAAESSPILAAVRLVGKAQGIEIHDRPEGQPAGKQGDLLAQICNASRIRSRRVILRDDWWRRDNGPLIAFQIPEDDPKARRPVALLPTSPQSYVLADPVAGTRVPVNEAVAETLSGDAHMLYPPLPARPVGLGDLARMAFGGRRRDLATILLMGLAGGLLGLLVPILTGQVFGTVIPGADRSQLLQITLALIVTSVAGAIFQVIRSLAVLRLGGKVDGAVQSAVWDRLLALPVTFFRRFTVGDLANRALGIDTIRDLLTGNVLTLALAAIFSVFSFLLLFYYSWRLALLASGMVLVLVVVTAALVWLQLRHQRAILALQGRIASLLFGLIHGIAKLRVAGAESRAYARWAERFAEQRRRTLAAQRAANAQAAFNAVYGVLTSLGVFSMVGFLANESLPLGEFLAFNAAFGQFVSAALSVVGVFSSVLAAVPVYERLRPILETVPEVDESKSEPGELAGEIEFSHVSFRYHEDTPQVLDDVSFRAGPGEFIALVGPSGSGKSTCLRLILGFEKPVAGSIYFDGQDLAGLAVQSVRRQIGVVLQSGRPMAGSIFSNIVGSANLGIDDAWEAARAAGLEDDVKAMPMGMHTVVSEGAETFSGGQKQRILIARAIVHRPRILLFDEATSALDNRTQEIVSRSLESLKATRIVIAHRLSTIQNADRIYVVESGRVVEQGTFQELLRRNGPFARLAERQIA